MEHYDIVFIDDEPMMTAVFKQMVSLKFNHWRVLASNDAEALFNRIEERSISAAVWIVDLIMPGKNGLQIAQAVRETGDTYADLIGYTAMDWRTLAESAEYSAALDVFSRVIGKKEGLMRVLSGLNAAIQRQRA